MSNSHMVLFLLFVLVIALAVTFAILSGKKQRESYKTWGSEKKSCPKCCGNIDWYLGPQLYKDYCPDSVPPAFKDTEQYDAYYFPKDTDNAHKYFGKMQENFVAERNEEWEGKTSFEKQNEECKQKGLKAANNPEICTEGTNYKPYANCKCVDEQNNCKECYPPIDLDKYQKP